MKPRTLKLSVLLIAVVGVVSGCATMGGGTYSILSLEQEIQLGLQVAAQVEEEQTVLDDPEIQAYITAIGEKLAAQAGRQDVEYTFKVIDNPETVNAFALPGGFMYIYTGLMLQCENEAELASIMGHEIGHVVGHHHGESITRQYIIEAGKSAASILTDSTVIQSITAGVLGVGGHVGGLKFSRDAERESDTLGMKYMVGAGYKPIAMVDFMQRVFVEQSGGGPGWQVLFSTHPLSENRVRNLTEMEAGYPPEIRNRDALFAERYKTMVLDRLK